MNKRSILIFLWSLTTVAWASKISALPTVNNLDGQYGSVAKVNVKVPSSKFQVPFVLLWQRPSLVVSLQKAHAGTP